MIYHFVNYVLDTQRLTVYYGEQSLSLRPKVFQVLCYLLEHCDRVVLVQELCDQVWPQRFISDATLRSTICAARQVLGDRAKIARFIRTYHGVGYRFIAPVTVYDETPDSAPLNHALPTSPLSLSAPPSEPVLEAEQPGLPALQHHVPLHPPDMPGDLAAERRQLTILVCSLAEVMALVEQLDLDDLYCLIRTFQSRSAGIVGHFDGRIAHYRSDGLVVYFGYPQAHDDDAWRAVQAGLALRQELKTQQASWAEAYGVRLAVRVGIHTGLVIAEAVKDVEGTAYLAIGEASMLAAQVHEHAASNTVLISEATYHLVGGFFRYQTGDLLHHNGHILATYHVLGKNDTHSRCETAQRHDLTPLVGREVEMALLRDRWEQVRQGMGQVVIVYGDEGIGKSRLIRELREHVAKAPHLLLPCRGSPSHQHTAFYPLSDLLQRLLQWQQVTSSTERLRRLENMLAPFCQAVDEILPLFTNLLMPPAPDSSCSSCQFTPQQWRQQLFDATIAMIVELAETQPVLLVMEDIHWFDPSTLELLYLLLDQIPGIPLYILMTSESAWPASRYGRAAFTQVMLPRLSPAQVEQMLTVLTAGQDLPREVRQHIVARSDGIPLFIEEITRTMVESACFSAASAHDQLATPLTTAAIPATLYDSLTARLDRLGSAKAVAQLGATIGRQFPHTILRELWPGDETTLHDALQDLIGAGLVYQRGVGLQATYRFKHALMRDAAYQGMLKSTRQAYHQQIAQTLEAQCAEIAATQPEVLAYHYTEAACNLQAADYWRQAGEHARQRSAYEEAMAHFSKGLQILATLPATPERSQCEVALLTALETP
jgi:class 3 adenylate cyclase/DNA-binding winged helix-turn-helix (wHTH) protein